jgi:hypothetical protein
VAFNVGRCVGRVLQDHPAELNICDIACALGGWQHQAMKSGTKRGEFPSTAARRGARTSSGHDLVQRLDALTDVARRPPGGVELSVGILLWPRFPLLSLAGLSDALRHAADVGDQSRQLRCTWTVLGVGAESVPSSCGVAVPVR